MSSCSCGPRPAPPLCYMTKALRATLLRLAEGEAAAAAPAVPVGDAALTRALAPSLLPPAAVTILATADPSDYLAQGAGAWGTARRGFRWDGRGSRPAVGTRDWMG